MKHKDMFGLTEKRYGQMMELYDNNEKWVKEVVDEWGVDNCNKGYAIFDYDGTGMLEVESIYDVGAFCCDEEAIRKAEEDGVEFIPLDELPFDEDDSHYWHGWIDTPDNRKRIMEYWKKYY